MNFYRSKQPSKSGRKQVCDETGGEAPPATNAWQLLLGGHVHRIDGMDDAVARGDISPGDRCATDAELVAVFGDRSRLALHHIGRGQFLDVSSRYPSGHHVVLQ